MTARIVVAAIVAALPWLALTAAAGLPVLGCVWLSGASATAAAVAAGVRGRRARPAGGSLLASAGLVAGLVLAAGVLASAWSRTRYAAAHQFLDRADRQAREGVTSVTLRPGRLVRPLMPPDEEGGPLWPGET